MSVQPDKEKHDLYRALSLDRFKILSNYVLCKPIPYSKITASGIVLGVLNENQYLVENCDRMFEVIKLPQRLRFKGKQQAAIRPMTWETDMDIQVGDTIWVTPFESVNAIHVKIDKTEYALIHYEEIRAAKRGDEVITVNGWLLCEEVKDEHGFGEFKIKSVNDKKLKVLHTAKPNKSYIREYEKGTYSYMDWDIHMEINSGDTVIKIDTRMGTKLEGEMFRKFDGDKRIIAIQSRHIGGVEHG